MNYESLMLGIVIGMVGLGLTLAATHRTYRRTLQHIADCEGCEKLPDGNFYYLIREDRHNDLLSCERNLSRVQEIIAVDGCSGESEFADGINTACQNHREILRLALLSDGESK